MIKNVYQLSNTALQRITPKELLQTAKNPIVVILDNIRSAHNVGAIFRLGDAFLIQKIYLCGITATPPHKGIQKTALGAENVVAWHYQKNILDVIAMFKKEAYNIIAVEQTNKSKALECFFFSKKKKYAFIFGHEVDGIHLDVLNHCDEYIAITQKGTKHSLNVSTCAGIALWQCFRSFI